jgi:hypothetical protein
VPIGLDLFVELVALALQHAAPTPPTEEWDARRNERVTKPAHYRFVDAGSGTGMTLHLAREVGQLLGKSVEAEGVELLGSMVQYARKRGFTIHACDLRDFDYRPYNVVYLYLPMQRMSDVMDRIRATVLPGTVIIAVVSGEIWTGRAGFRVLYQHRSVAVALRENGNGEIGGA